MSLYSATPLSIGQTIDTGFRACRRVFKAVLPVSLVVALLGQVPELSKFAIPAAGDDGFPWLVALGIVIGALVWAVLYFTLYNGWLAALDRALQEQPVPGLGEVFLLGSGTVGSTIGAGLLYALAVCVGMLLLVIPGFYLMIALMFFWFYAVLERQGALDSLSSSRALVKGHWWRVMAVLSVAGLIYFIGIATIVSVLAVLFGLSAAGGGLRSLEALEKMAQPQVSAQIKPGVEIAILLLQAAANTVLLPLWNTISLVLFRDLQLRKSGADLAARAAAA